MNKKVLEINNMKSPTSQKEVQQFIGVVNYYNDVWERRSHVLAPSTNIMYIKVKSKWTKIGQGDFKEINRIVARIILLTYPDFIEELKMHINTRKLKL